MKVLKEDIANAAEKAADLIFERGLAKEVFEDVDGSFCIVGAIQHVQGNWDVDCAVVIALGNYLGGDCIGPSGEVEYALAFRNVVLFNDDPATEMDEAVDKLKMFAKDVRNAA